MLAQWKWDDQEEGFRNSVISLKVGMKQCDVPDEPKLPYLIIEGLEHIYM